jgi:hypothetical protein
MFKSGAVRIEKCKDESGNVKIHAKEQQTHAIHSVEHKNSQLTPSATPPSRAASRVLDGRNVRIDQRAPRNLRQTPPQLVHDLEINAGVKNIRRITEQMREAMEPREQLRRE